MLTLNLSQTRTTLHHLLHLLQRRKLVLIRGPGKISHLRNIHPRRPKIILRPQIRKPINLKVPVGARIWTVVWNHQSIRTQRLARIASEDIALDENLIVAAGVDGLVEKVDIEIVVDVLVAEAAGWPAGSFVAPVVVVVCNVEMALIYISQCVAVSYERALPVVVEVVP